MIYLSIYLVSLITCLIMVVMDKNYYSDEKVLQACVIGLLPIVNMVFILATFVACIRTKIHKEKK